MDRYDALVVGGGPAGSTCARALRLAGWKVCVLDRARFPRDKVCGGWVTPEVFQILELEPSEYRSSGLTLQEITGFRTGLIGGASVETRYRNVVSYAIRRCEFDNFLLRRAGVKVIDGTPLASLTRHRDRWVANGHIEAPVIVGAGGHFCPVVRHLQGARDHIQPVVAKEAEFRLSGPTPIAPETPELFFSHDLEGYGWCVRKGSYLNVGIGRRARDEFADHFSAFVSFLVRSGRLPDTTGLVWHGHAYHATGAGSRPLLGAGALIVGDAAGLAYPESGEGIRPAVESGTFAARTLVAAQGRYDLDDLMPYDRWMRDRHGPVARTPDRLRPMLNRLGRALLGSRVFTRHVILDRWFLRA